MALTFADDASSSPTPKSPRCATPTASWASCRARAAAPSKAASRSRSTCWSPATRPSASKTARCCPYKGTCRNSAHPADRRIPNPTTCCGPPTRARRRSTSKTATWPRLPGRGGRFLERRAPAALRQLRKPACQKRLCSEASEMSLLSPTFSAKPKTASVARSACRSSSPTSAAPTSPRFPAGPAAGAHRGDLQSTSTSPPTTSRSSSKSATTARSSGSHHAAPSSPSKPATARMVKLWHCGLKIRRRKPYGFDSRSGHQPPRRAIVIVLDLCCEHEHRFEAWFASSRAFDTRPPPGW